MFDTEVNLSQQNLAMHNSELHEARPRYIKPCHTHTLTKVMLIKLYKTEVTNKFMNEV